MKPQIAALVILVSSSALAAPVKVVTHFEYLEATSGKLKIHHEEQNISVTQFSMESFSQMKTGTYFSL